MRNSEDGTCKGSRGSGRKLRLSWNPSSVLIFSVIFPPLDFIVCHDKEQLKHINVMCLGWQVRGARLDVEG